MFINLFILGLAQWFLREICRGGFRVFWEIESLQALDHAFTSRPGEEPKQIIKKNIIFFKN